MSEQEVFCEYRQPEQNRGVESDGFRLLGTYMTKICVFGMTDRACYLLISELADIPVCPSLEFGLKTCPIYQEYLMKKMKEN